MSFLPDGSNIHRARNIVFPDEASVLSTSAFWFDFTNAATMYKDLVGTPVAADGDDIAVIRDANGTLNCLRENVPWLTYRTAVVNGNSVGRNVGNTNTFFHTLRAMSAPGIPTGAAFNLTVPFSNGKNAITVIMAINLTADGTQRNVFGDDVGGFMFSQHVLNAAQNRFTVSMFDAGVDKQVNQDYANSSWAVLTWRQTATQNQSRRNGAAAFNSIACTGPATLANQARFGRGFISVPFIGDVAELVLFNRALSDADCLTVERFFGTKVGIVI